MRELPKSDLAISIQVHPSDNGCHIALLNVFLELLKEFTNGIKVKVAVALLVNDGEGSHCTEVHLSFKGFLFLLYFKVVMHFSNLIIIIR